MVRETAEVIKGEEVTKKLLSGTEKIFQAVVTTLGPYGKNVALTKIYNNPHLTKDGVTVAKGINLKDPIENIAAQIIKEAAAKTAKEAGDGTSSTVVLASILFENIVNYFKSKKENIKFSDFKKEIEDISDLVIKNIKEASVSVEGNLDKVALVASNNDLELSKLVSEAFTKIGVNGIVSVSDSRTLDTNIQTTEGIRLETTHILSSMAVEAKEIYKSEPKVLVTNLDIKTDIEALRIISIQEKIEKPLLVICNDLDGQAAEILAYNKKTRKVPIVVVRGPFISQARKEAFLDLSIATGATYLEKESGWASTDFNPEILGSCDYFEVTNKETNIIGRHGSEEEINKRISYYEDKIKTEGQGLEENYKKRINILNGGASIIYVGGTSEIEVVEKKDRLDDTIRAVKSALESGVVPGGGVTYNNIIKKLTDRKNDIPSYNIMLTSILSISDNILYNKLGNTPSPEDFESLKKEVLERDILDPTSVLINTVYNATRAALLLAGTDCIIVKEEL